MEQQPARVRAASSLLLQEVHRFPHAPNELGVSDAHEVHDISWTPHHFSLTDRNNDSIMFLHKEQAPFRGSICCWWADINRQRRFNQPGEGDAFPWFGLCACISFTTVCF